MWTIPDKGEGQNDIQSILFQEYLEVLVAGLAGIDYVLTGCTVTAQGSPNMTVAVASGSVESNNIFKKVTGANATIGAANATNPRIDLVVIDSTGAIQTRAGTAAAAPKPPNRSANDVVLASIYVPANDTTITSDQITDMRVVRPSTVWDGEIIKTADQDVTASATLTDDTELQFTIPAAGTYDLELKILYAGNTTAGDYKCDIVPTAGSMLGFERHIGSDTTANAVLSSQTRIAAATMTAIAAGTSAAFATIAVLKIDAMIQFSAACTVKFRFAQNTLTASTSARTLAGSVFRYRKLA